MPSVWHSETPKSDGGILRRDGGPTRVAKIQILPSIESAQEAQKGTSDGDRIARHGFLGISAGAAAGRTVPPASVDNRMRVLWLTCGRDQVQVRSPAIPHLSS
jgi:hypothetical protein